MEKISIWRNVEGLLQIYNCGAECLKSYMFLSNSRSSAAFCVFTSINLVCGRSLWLFCECAALERKAKNRQRCRCFLGVRVIQRCCWKPWFFTWGFEAEGCKRRETAKPVCVVYTSSFPQCAGCGGICKVHSVLIWMLTKNFGNFFRFWFMAFM